MKTAIHPQYNTDVKVTCACGNTFTTGSTLSDVSVEICSKCHPFYTGKQKLVDTARRVDKFEARIKKAKTLSKSRKGKKVKREESMVKKAEKELAKKTARAASQKEVVSNKKEEKSEKPEAEVATKQPKTKSAADAPAAKPTKKGKKAASK